VRGYTSGQIAKLLAAQMKYEFMAAGVVLELMAWLVIMRPETGLSALANRVSQGGMDAATVHPERQGEYQVTNVRGEGARCVVCKCFDSGSRPPLTGSTNSLSYRVVDEAPVLPSAVPVAGPTPARANGCAPSGNAWAEASGLRRPRGWRACGRVPSGGACAHARSWA